MTTNYYHDAYKFTPIIVFGYLFLGFGNIWSAGLHLENKAKWFWIFGSIGAFTNVTLNFIFLSKYGLFAAALTTLLSLSIQPIGYYVITKNYYDIKLPHKSVILIFIIYFLISFFSTTLFQNVENHFLLILTKVVIYIIFIKVNFLLGIISTVIDIS